LDAVVVEDLHKTYPNGTRAVQGVSFRVKRGEIYGILGPNGAGKSTTIGMLGTLVRATAGRAFVGGHDVRLDPLAVRRIMGFAMQDAGVDDLATGREFLRLQGRLYGLSADIADRRARQLLRLFELEAAADKRIKAYSGGMRRRIDLAAALIHLPRILFLDEPTEGLDPRSRQALWATLRRLNQRLGTTIILSTHYMEEADHLCHRLAIIDAGRIVAEDTPARLKANVGGQSLMLDYPADAAADLERAERALTKASVGRLQRAGRQLVVYVEDAAERTPHVLRLLDRAGAAPASLRIQQPTLDDVYLRYTGRKLEQAEGREAAA
jgi:ABC-2 type transport system ATP-binding protein